MVLEPLRNWDTTVNNSVVLTFTITLVNVSTFTSLDYSEVIIISVRKQLVYNYYRKRLVQYNEENLHKKYNLLAII